jgi:acetyltransferase-like isoleucine patch superfamily enzyme
LRIDQVHVIRHKVLPEGKSVRSVAKEMSVSRNIVAKYLKNPGPRRRAARKQKRVPVILVTIEDNVVVSQEAFITTGFHDIYESMDLVVKPVIIRQGAWVTTRCMVLQGVEIGQNAILTPGSVANKSLPPASIYGGNPAKSVRERWEHVP